MKTNDTRPFALLVSGLLFAACAGSTNDTGVNPYDFVSGGAGGAGMSGAAGMGGAAGMAGGGGMGGSVSGAGGMGGGAPAPADCDAYTQVLSNPASCSLAFACHGQGAEANGALLTGTESEVIARLLNMPSTTGNCTGMYINATAPDSSILYLKMTVNHDSACPARSRMPSGLPVVEEDIECVRGWVHAVAAGVRQ